MNLGSATLSLAGTQLLTTSNLCLVQATVISCLCPVPQWGSLLHPCPFKDPVLIRPPEQLCKRIADYVSSDQSLPLLPCPWIKASVTVTQKADLSQPTPPLTCGLSLPPAHCALCTLASLILELATSYFLGILSAFIPDVNTDHFWPPSALCSHFS